jgi:hypothetical protein
MQTFASKNTHGFVFGLGKAGPFQIRPKKISWVGFLEEFRIDSIIQPKTVGIFGCKCLSI